VIGGEHVPGRVANHRVEPSRHGQVGDARRDRRTPPEIELPLKRARARPDGIGSEVAAARHAAPGAAAGSNAGRLDSDTNAEQVPLSTAGGEPGGAPQGAIVHRDSAASRPVKRARRAPPWTGPVAVSVGVASRETRIGMASRSARDTGASSHEQRRCVGAARRRVDGGLRSCASRCPTGWPA